MARFFKITLGAIGALVLLGVLAWGGWYAYQSTPARVASVPAAPSALQKALDTANAKLAEAKQKLAQLTEAGAPVAPPPAVSAPAEEKVECVRVFVGISAIKEPARYVVSIQDVQDGLLEKMKTCNGDAASAMRADSTKSVDVKVVQGSDGWATVKVPGDRKAHLRARFHSTDSRLAANPFWESKAFDGRTEIKLDPVQQGSAIVIGKKDP